MVYDYATQHPLGKGGQRTLNSLTKYPSIPTYHTIDKKTGTLSEPCVDFYDASVIVTEKVDGTNGRIVQLPGGDYFIGSREELLYARGDRIVNPSLGIVPALLPLAEQLVAHNHAPSDMVIRTLYLEVYGHGIGPGKNYTGQKSVGYRLFDVNAFHVEYLEWTPEQAAGWRDRGGQPFISETQLNDFVGDLGITLTPRIKADALPSDVAGTHEWLRYTLPLTHVALDAGASGRPEGVVMRTQNRAVIAKIRFEDYERTQRKQEQPASRLKSRNSKPLTREIAE